MSLRRIALLGVLSLACLAVAACVDIDPAYEAFSRLLEQRAAGLQSKAPASNQRTGGSAPVGSSLIPDPAAPPAANSTAAPKGGSNVRTAATADVHPCGNGVCDAGETCSTCPQVFLKMLLRNKAQTCARKERARDMPINMLSLLPLAAWITAHVLADLSPGTESSRCSQAV